MDAMESWWITDVLAMLLGVIPALIKGFFGFLGMFLGT
jgi:hypothetical protein